ncbi:glycosyltransferase [Salipaludibacillus aurantiacus]
MKKKVLFTLINMNIGGTEKALLDMVRELPEDQYDITILMLEEYGGFLDSVPLNVKVRYLKNYDLIKPVIHNPPRVTSMDYIKKGKLIKSICFSTYYLVSKFKKNKSFLFDYLLKNYPQIDNDYDIAVAYAGPMDFISYFVLNKITAKKKVQWIHFDITKIGFDKAFANKNYDKFDKIFVVSEEAKNKVIKTVPGIKKKTEVFYNLISPNRIKQLAKEGKGFDDVFDGKRILTVGRLTKEKGLDLAIKALARLISEGYNVRWYCVGEGKYRDDYEKLIKTYNLENKFILLGSDTNPYRYMDQCDIYVQCSRHEGYCITLAEARHLNKPIVTTNFTGAGEHIKNGETGLIVNISEDGIYEGLKRLIDNEELSRSFEIRLNNETGHLKNDELKKIHSL